MKNVMIITGGTGGIGKAILEKFKENKWTLVNISRRKANIPQVINLNFDLSSNEWEIPLKKELKTLLKKKERISLVHNAAMLLKDNIENIKHQDFQKVLQLNVLAPSLLSKILIPSMKKNSSIIYIGSTLSTKAVSNSHSYVVSKHALVGTMRATCQDLFGKGIHSVCVCPGFTDTKMLRTHLSNDPKIIKQIKNSVSYKRLIKPSEIASVVYYAAETTVLNGHVIHANLGQLEI